MPVSQALSNQQAIHDHPVQGESNGRSVVTTADALRQGFQHLSSALQNIPNPLYYMTQMPGKVLLATLLLNRSVTADARSFPTAESSVKLNGTVSNSSELAHMGVLPSLNGESQTQALKEIARDGGESALQRIILSLQQSDGQISQSDEAHGGIPQGDPNKWKPVAQLNAPKNLNHPLTQDETTTDGKFARTPESFDSPHVVAERKIPDGKSKSASYRFVLPGAHTNDLEPLKKCATPPPVIGNDGSQKEGSGKCINTEDGSPGNRGRGMVRAELTNCFHTAGSEPKADDKGLLKASGMYLNSCPESVSANTVSGSMKIRIDQSGPATIFNIRSMPDRLLYRDGSDKNHWLSPESSGKTYESLVADGMRFEQEGPAPFSIGIVQKSDRGRPYLAIMGRSDNNLFATENDCLIPFTGKNWTPLNEAKCCDGKISVSYLHHEPVGYIFSHDWVSVVYEVAFSDYSGANVTDGRAKVWIDGENVVNTVLHIGANNRPERGGGNYYATFGVSDMSSKKPVVVKFRDVKFNSGPLHYYASESPMKPLDSVEYQCPGQLEPECT